MANIEIVKVPVEKFAIKMVDKRKKSLGANSMNAGFFGNYKEKGSKFTLPSGHLVCDYAAESSYVRFYCEQRGTFNGTKFRFDASKRDQWGNPYDKQFCDKAVSTLLIHDGKARVEDISTLPECEYAISGVPVLRNGGDCKFNAYVKKQGWGGGSLYGTWHAFVGIKDDPTEVYLIGMKTKTYNMIKTSEAFKVFKEMGFRDVLKYDGGGSFYMNVKGKVKSTTENRRINTAFTF